MPLTAEQLKTFDEDGYLFLPDCFSEEEVALLRAEAEEIYREDRQEVWREKSGAPRTAFAAHTYNEAFRRLGAHPRLVEPVEQLFGEPLYMHQFKINAKAPFDGELWQWHQDYGIWARDDGMPEPRAMNISVFLDEVMPFNGPLMFIPRSHKAACWPPSHDTATTSYPIWTLDHDDDHAARRRGRHRRADRQAGQRADVPRQPGAREPAQHHALSAQDRLPDALRRLQPHHEVHAAGVDRPPRFHARSSPWRRRADRAGARLSQGGLSRRPDLRRQMPAGRHGHDKAGRMPCRPPHAALAHPARTEPRDGPVSLFQKEWHIYRKVVEKNYFFHREAYATLREVLTEEMAVPFRFLDIACGDASGSVRALIGTRVFHYHGIDLSEPALELARKALQALPCLVTLERRDFVAALGDRSMSDRRRLDRPLPPSSPNAAETGADVRLAHHARGKREASRL